MLFRSHVRAAIAEREDISEEQAMMLAHDLSNLVKEKLVNNPNVSYAVKKLLNILNKRRQSSISVNTLDELKDDRNINVREKVAQSAKISIELIEYLAEDSVPLVRRAIAANNITPANILNKLKSDRSLTVRLAVAENPNTSIDTLQELLNDEASKIVETANNTLKRRSL